MPTTYPQLARETACTPDAVSSYSLHERRRDQAMGKGDPLEAEPRTYPHHSRRNDPGVRLLRGGRAGGEDVGWIGARDPQIVGFLVAPRSCTQLRSLAPRLPWRRSPGPAKLAFRLVNLVVVDRGITAPHKPVFVELPQFISVTSPPTTLHVVALVLEPHRDAVLRKAPEILLKSVVELTRLLAPEEAPDGLPALEELVAVAPLRVLRVG